jgi:YaaC-like Protein
MRQNLANVLDRRGLLAPHDISDVWQRLSIYESQEILASRLPGERNHAAKKEKSAEVSSHLIQARQYFTAARGAEFLTKPLLLYYGVLSFSRGLILFRRRGLREAGLAQGHGVGASNWKNELGQDINRIIDLPLEISRGTFTELSLATSNQEVSNIIWTGNYQASHYQLNQLGTASIDLPTTISLREVLTRLPDVRGAYEEVTGERSFCIPSLVELYNPNYGAWLYLLDSGKGLPGREELIRLFSLAGDARIDYDSNHHKLGNISNAGFWIPETENREFIAELDLPPIKDDSAGMNHLVPPFSSGLQLSTLSLLFLTSYAIGMLVRYFPSVWSRLVAGHSDRMVPLLKLSVDTVEHRFPGLILEALGTSGEPKN